MDEPETAERVAEMATLVYPRRPGIVKQHTDMDVPLWDRLNLRKQIEQLYGREVTLPSGGVLVFDHAEALTAVDINSGKIGGESNFREMALKTNVEAAEEIARQLRLRDIGGQVVIDFIEMKDRKHVAEVEKTLRAAFKSDRAAPTWGASRASGCSKSCASAWAPRPCPSPPNPALLPGLGQRRNRVAGAHRAQGHLPPDAQGQWAGDRHGQVGEDWPCTCSTTSGRGFRPWKRNSRKRSSSPPLAPWPGGSAPICCGPCAIAPVKRLQEAGWTVVGLFYNPNIQPAMEYLRRREGVAAVAGILDVAVRYVRLRSAAPPAPVPGRSGRPVSACWDERLDRQRPRPGAGLRRLHLVAALQQVPGPRPARRPGRRQGASPWRALPLPGFPRPLGRGVPCPGSGTSTASPTAAAS